MDRNAYMRQYRTTPEGQRAVEADKMRQAARRRAKDRLVEAHQEEFEELLQDELKKGRG